MPNLDRWKLSEHLTVFQIVLLMAGYDPSELADKDYAHWPVGIRIDVEAYLHSVKSAAIHDRVEFVPIRFYDQNGDGGIDWDESTIEVESLREWLRSRGSRDRFFVESSDDTDHIADRASPFYAPKLAAAVRAWNEVTADPAALRGKAPKQALENWLQQHAGEYGLIREDGLLNKLGIEEICKVANWKLKGGATATPTPSRQQVVGLRREDGLADLDHPTPQQEAEDSSDIPF